MTLIGYVVVEWNQASRRPDLAMGMPLFDTDDRESAEDVAAKARADIAANGRRERYAVCEVHAPDDTPAT